MLPPGSEQARLYEAEQRALAETAFLVNQHARQLHARNTERILEAVGIYLARLEGPNGPDMSFAPADSCFIEHRSTQQLSHLADLIGDTRIPLRDIFRAPVDHAGAAGSGRPHVSAGESVSRPASRMQASSRPPPPTA